MEEEGDPNFDVALWADRNAMNFSELNIFYKSSLTEKFDPNNTGLHRDIEIFLEQKFEKF